MCAPLIVMAVVSLVGAGISAYGQHQQGKALKEVSKNNQTIAEHRAKDALERGRQLQSQARKKGKSARGAQRAAFAKQGVFVGGESQAEAMQDIDHIAALDEYTIGINAERESTALINQGRGFAAQGNISSAAATTGAVGTVLGATGSVANKWYAHRKVA